MKNNRLPALIDQAIELLADCGCSEQADWFAEVRRTLESVSQKSSEFADCLRKLDRVLAGMGSFADLPLRSESGKMTDQEARSLQWKLAADLGDVIEKALEGREDKQAGDADS